MKILFIGDIVGSMGREALESYLPRLKRKYAPDVVIANGENAAAGRGITKSIYQDLLFMGVDMVTMGKLPQTPRAKKVIEYSMEEARNLNHNYVGTEHLLLGLAREEEGAAARIMFDTGLDMVSAATVISNVAPTITSQAAGFCSMRT